MSPRVARASLTTLSGAVLALARAGTAALSASLLLGHLGKESYGLAVTITGMASWLSVSQYGIGQTVRNEIIRMPEAAGTIFSNAFATLLGIVAGLGLLASAAAFVVPWHAVLNAQHFQHLPLVVASIWIALFTALFGLVRAPYSAFQAEYRLTPVLFLGIIFSVALLALGISRQWSPTHLVAASLIANLIGFALGLLLMPSALGFRVCRPTRIHRGGFWFFVIEVCAVFIFQADIFLVNFFLGPAEAAVYALHIQLFAVVQLGANLVTSPYWPAFGEAWSSGNHQWLRSAARNLVGTTAALSSAGVLIILLICRPLMDFWSHGQVRWNPVLALLLGLGAVLQSVTGVFATVLGALSVVREPARVIVFQAVLNIGVCIWLLRRFGVAGVAAGSLLTYALTSGAWLPFQFRKVAR